MEIWEKGIAKEIAKWSPEYWSEERDNFVARINYDGQQNYLFRAMTEKEAGCWLSGNGYDIVEADGHQGFSPELQYAEKYFGNGQNKYPIILAFQSVGYIEAAKSIGIQNGALEDGVIAYGIGWKSKNSVQPTDETNKKLAEEWERNSINTGAIQRIMKAAQVSKIDIRKSDVKRKVLNALMFIESLQSISIAKINKTCYQKYRG